MSWRAPGLAFAVLALTVIAGCSDEPSGGTDAAAGDGQQTDAHIATDASDNGDGTGEDIADSGEDDAADLPDGATPPGCPGKPGCPCEGDAACDDGDLCTTDDKCLDGSCGFPAPTNCDDGNTCTDDVCDPASGCTSTVAGPLPCNDGNVCTLDDSCDGSTCKGGKPRTCNDGNVCTDDLCIDEVGCTFVQNNAQCRDGNACIKPALCNFGACPASPIIPCDDKKPCTIDTCTPETGCESVPMPAASTACDGELKWGRCFKALKQKATWVQARAACRAWGGELVSITDKYDNAFVAQVAQKACGKQGAWIGLTDVAREWTWQWSDGTPYGYRSWNQGEPNNSGNEDFAEIVPGGGWNDLGAKHERGCMVCARRLATPCSDGDGCTSGDVCGLTTPSTQTDGNAAPMAVCVTGTEVTGCDDQTPCTLDSCDPKKGCVHTLAKDKAPCGDGSCSKGVCFWPEKSAFSSCKDVLAKVPSAPSGVYALKGTDAKGKAITYKAWCEMGGDYGAGWTLALQSDGTKPTLAWASKLWTSKDALNADKAPWAKIDAKLASYWSVTGTEALVVMERGNVRRWLKLPLALDKDGKKTPRSLHAVIAPGKQVATAIDYKDWKQLVPGSALQFHCHAQGFNAVVKGAGKARIGIIGNNENNCDTPDSWLGVGGHEKMCSNSTVKSTGNVACIWTDNGNRRLPAFAWVLVR